MSVPLPLAEPKTDSTPPDDVPKSVDEEEEEDEDDESLDDSQKELSSQMAMTTFVLLFMFFISSGAAPSHLCCICRVDVYIARHNFLIHKILSIFNAQNVTIQVSLNHMFSPIFTPLFDFNL